jgi:hypothetical protein
LDFARSTTSSNTEPDGPAADPVVVTADEADEPVLPAIAKG